MFAGNNMGKPVAILHFFILALSIQLMALCSCHKRSPQPTSPGNGNDSTKITKDSLKKYTQYLNGSHNFLGTEYVYGRTGQGQSPDTTININLYCTITVINDSTIALASPLYPDTLTMYNPTEENITGFSYQDVVTQNEYIIDSVKYNYHTHIITYYQHEDHQGHGHIYNLHTL